MTKVWHKFANYIKTSFKKLLNLIARRTPYFIGIIFTWVIPIIMLNEQIALIENVQAHLKLTWLGAIVAIVVLLKVRKQIYAKIYQLKHSWLRGVCLTLYRAVSYGLILLVLYGVTLFGSKLLKWWLCSGISIAIGAVFYIVDEIIRSKNGGK